MAKKPSPKELKAEGEELSKNLADIRKKQHNFAMQIGKEGLVFHIDRKKPADVLWRNAKKDGGGPKGAKGRVNMSGKILELDCDDPDSVPKNLMKLAKKHFAERGQPIRLVFKDIEDDEDDAPEAKGDEAKTARRKPAEAPPEEKPAPRAASAPEEPTSSAPEPETRSEPETADAGGPSDDALRETLKKEYDDLAAKREAAEKSDNKGVVKKMAGLIKMFESQLENNPKKANSVLRLMTNTLEIAEKSGDLKGDGDSGASRERMARIADLDARVDELLAQLAA